MDFALSIYAVGETVRKALEALAVTARWGEVHDIRFQETAVPCEWYVRFSVGNGRTGMKAAGTYLTGGVIVTWWK